VVYRNTISLHITAISILFSLSILTYLNCLQNQFVYDDNSTIIENHFIEDWSNFPTLFTQDYFTKSGELTYRPIVTLSYFVDYSLWHSRPTGYHITNILSHSINSLLTYILIFHLLNHASKQITSPQKYNKTSFINHAFLASLLFILHPIVNETVNAISYREDLLATNFVLISFLLFLLSGIKSLSQDSRLFYPETTPIPKIKYFIPFYIAAMITYFLALLSKESAIVLPGLIFCYCFLFYERRENLPHPSLFKTPPPFPHHPHYTNNNEMYQNNPSKEIYPHNTFRFFFNNFTKISLSPYFLGYIGISILYLILRFIILHNIQEKIDYPEKSFPAALFTSIKIIGRYISNIFIPCQLNVDYHVLHIKSPLSIAFIVSLSFLISVFVIIFRLKSNPISQPFKHQHYDKNQKTFPPHENFYFLLFAILWFFVSLFPVINIIPLSNLMADRYLYLPFIGFCIFFSIAITHQKRIFKYSFIIPVFIICIVITMTKNKHWKNEFTLWHNSSQNPLCSFTTYNNLGTQYTKKDDPDTALAYYHKAIEKSQEIGFTSYAAVHYNMGNAYKKKNLPDKAISSYKKAIQINQNYKQAHNNLGEIYFDRGQYDEALDEYTIALTIDPNFTSAHNNLGVLYNKKGMQEHAIAEYERALISDSLNSDAYYNLGNIYESQELFELAEKAYQSALEIDPTLAYVHNNLGTLYDKKGLLDKAIEEYRQAIKHNPLYPYAHNNLGTSLAKKGDMDNALTEFQEAVRLLPDNPDFHFNLGYIFLRTGNNVLALKEFEEAIRIEPSHTEALLHAGIVHYEQGNKEMAAKLWKVALTIDPNHIKTKKYWEMLEKEAL